MIEEQNGVFAAATPADDAAHLLIIDDDRRIRALLSRMLKPTRYLIGARRPPCTIFTLQIMELYR